jgi:uncharacterized protein (TIGR02001 family)
VRAGHIAFLAVAFLPAPAAAAELSGEAGLVSDYRYRGISLSRGRPALQAELTVEHESGLYADLWGSTLGHGDEAEINLTGGFSKDLSEQVSLDLSGTYFLYPKSAVDNYVEGTALVRFSRGAASVGVGFSYAPPQRGTGHEGNSYWFGTGDYAVPKSPVTLKASLGYERGAFDDVARGGKWDWALGAEMAFKPAKFGLAYVGSNTDGRDRHVLVASAFVAF